MDIESMQLNNWTIKTSEEVYEELYSALRHKLNGQKFIKQSDIVIHKTMRSTYLGLRLSGVYLIEFSENNQKIYSYLLMIWHYMTISLLIFYNITTFISIISSDDNRLTFYTELLRLSFTAFRSIVLRSQRYRIKQLMLDIQNSCSLFPNVSILKNTYYKLVIFVYFYAVIQGKKLFCIFCIILYFWILLKVLHYFMVSVIIVIT